MNLKTLMKSVLMTALLLGLMSIASFAQVFVSNTNGDDLVGQGTAVSPYKTISYALSVAPAGSVISIASDTYNETVTVTKPYTLVSTTFNGLSTVTVNGIVINTANSSDVVKIGVTADGSQKFKAPVLTLTKGNLQITGSNVVITGGGTITRTAGTIDNTPTTTNVNVVYGNVSSSLSAGAEIPANLGTGSLTIDLTADKAVSFANAITTKGGITITTGNATFNGNLTFTDCAFVNNAAANTVTVNGNVQFNLNASLTNPIKNWNTGEVKINGTVNFANMTQGSGAAGDDPGADFSGTLLNHAAGKLTLAQGFTTTYASYATSPVTKRYAVISAQNDAASSLFAFGGPVTLSALTNTAGSFNLAGGTVSGAVVNSGTLELLANTTFSNVSVTNNSIVKLNSNTLTLSASGVNFVNNGKVISATAATVGSGTLAITNTATIDGTAHANSLELPNISLTANKTVTIYATNVYGSVSNAGTMTLVTTKVFGDVNNTKTFKSSVSTISGNVVSSGLFETTTSLTALTVEGDFTSSAALNLGAKLTVKGNYAQNVGGALSFGGNTFEVQGNWVRSSNVPGDVTTAAGAQLLFTAGNSQIFTPGASLTLYDVVVNKDANTIATLNQSLQISHDFKIQNGKVDLGDYNIRMNGTTPVLAGTFTNNGNFYSTTGNGYLIFEGAGATYNISCGSTGMFSNMDIRNNSLVVAQTAINFSGKLILRNGTLDVNGKTFTYKNDLMTVPSVTRYTDAGHMVANGGTIQVATDVVYDLTYTGPASAAVAAEWIPGGIRNLTIATGDDTHAYVVSGPSANFTIEGNLTVNLAQTLNLGGFKLTFAADGTTHSVVGTVTNGSLEVTGDGVAINGSTDDNAAAEIPSLEVGIASSKTFTSSNIKLITGNLLVDDGTSTVTMNAKTATITGNVTLTAGSLNLNMNSTVSAHGGNLVVTAGAMTYTRNTDNTNITDANRTIGGNVTLTAGTLTLGSKVLVAGSTSMVDGSLALNGNNFVQLGSDLTPDFARSGAGTISGNGTVVFDATVKAIDVTPGTSFSIPSVEFKGTAILGTTFNGAMTISNSLLHTSGVVNLNTLTLSGNTYTYKAGSYSGTLVVTGSNVTAKLYGTDVIPNLTLNTDGKMSLTTNDPDHNRTMKVSTAFTQTAGELAQGAQDFEVDGAYTRVAGTISQTSGTFIFNTAGAVDLADGFAVDNMKVAQTVDFSTKAFTVNKYLTLAAGELRTSENGKLSLGNGATIERQAVGATLKYLPTFGSNMNVFYSTDVVEVLTAKELPATVNNLTVAMGTIPTVGSVKLAANVKVNGTLSLASLLAAAYSNSVAITMAEGATLELKANGTTVLDENLTKAGQINIVYNGANATTTRELGPTTNATTHTAGNVTFKSTVALDAKATFTGTVTFDGGSLNQAGNDLYVQGDVTETTNGGFFAPAALSNIYFSGSADTKLTLNSNKSISNLNVHLAKTNGTNTVTLVGANLDFATNSQTLYFGNGLLVTGSNFVKLFAPLFGQGQGFDRTAVTGSNTSHIVGNVKKQLVNNGTIQGSTEQRSEFPVGSLTMYRPAAITFNPQNGISNVPNATLVVSHKDYAPAGTVGLPIADGVSAGVNVSRYPNFFWNVSSEPTSITPSIIFDLELGAAGFTNFDNVTNVRTIRRNGTEGDVSNPWLLQGGTSLIAYDNNIINGVPTIVVRNAMSGIIAGGAVYTLGLKSNMTVANPIANQTLTKGSAATQISLSNPALVTGNTGTLTYTAQSSNPSVATVAVAGDVLSITPVGEGSADISVTARDVNNDFLTSKFSVTVKAVTNFAVKGKVTYDNTAATALKNVTVTLTPGNYSATSGVDGTYSIANVPNGTYTVTATTTAPWDSTSINATDALVAANYYNGKQVLSALRLSAADVNASNTVNNTDALLIVRRYASKDFSFAKGSWTFSSASVTVNGADVVNANVNGLMVGDANGSFVPTSNLPKSSAKLVTDGTVKVNVGTTISVPVKVDAENLGALSLKFRYSEELGTFTGVSSKLEGIVTSAANGVVTVAWADLSGKAAFNAKVDESIITLNFKPTEAFKAGKSFGVDLVSGELADENATVINAMLKSSTVEAVVPSQFALNHNYPNPFNPTTTISYDLPVNSKVSLVVTNVLGQEVATLVNGVQDAGSYKVQFNANNLTSGIYFYTINVSNGDQKFVQTYKMILMK